MQRGINTMTTRLNTNEPYTLIRDEIVECSNSIRSTSDASDHRIGKLASLFRELRFDLPTDDSLEITDDGREGVGTNGRTNEVVGIVESSDPFSHSFVNGVLEGLSTGCDWNDLDCQLRVLKRGL
jgi:hypothetical protein